MTFSDLFLTGTIPSSIGSLTSLYLLYMSNVGLSGTIPSSIGLLTSLKFIYLDSNKLIGTIPSSIGSFYLYILYFMSMIFFYFTNDGHRHSVNMMLIYV